MSASLKRSLLVDILSPTLHFLSVERSSLPSLSFPLIQLLLSITTPSSLSTSSSVFSWTETEGHRISLLIDSNSLNSLRHFSAAFGWKWDVIGRPLRALSVHEGHVGPGKGQLAPPVSAVSTSLARAGYSIFYVSTALCDYVLVPQQQLHLILEQLAQDFILIPPEHGHEQDVEHEDQQHSPQQCDKHSYESEVKTTESNPEVESKHNEEEAGAHEHDPFHWPSSSSPFIPPSTAHPITLLESIKQLALVSSHKSKLSPAYVHAHEDTKDGLPPQSLTLRVLPHELRVHSLTSLELQGLIGTLLSFMFFAPEPAHFFSYTLIDQESSIIAERIVSDQLLQQLRHTSAMPVQVPIEQWNAIEAVGFYDYRETGLVARLAQPLSEKHLRFFYYSTFFTGFVLCDTKDVAPALEAYHHSKDILVLNEEPSPA